MRLLYIDIDSLRPDHLGCYGYHRDTSPNIDEFAQDATRFTNVYISDAPCLPSRTALWSGRNGFHTGVVNHGGVASQPYIEGRERGHRDVFSNTGWMQALQTLGMRTATISPFGQRHAAWHWYANFNEIYNSGKSGMETADEVVPTALDWLERNGQADNWFLHVNVWDPHTPFRTPMEYGEPFENSPIPEWMTEDVWQKCWDGFGPHSPQEPNGVVPRPWPEYPRNPDLIDSMSEVTRWFNGYDTGIHYADMWVGKIFDKLKDMGIYEEMIVVISADHGENIGELNVWGDHQTADQITCNVPLIIRYPGITDGTRVDTALHYHYDWAATIIDLLGGEVPDNWDGKSFADAFKTGSESGHEYVVVSQGTWACQRGVRFVHESDDYICLRTYHDGYKNFEPIMLFNLTSDPYEQHDVAATYPELVNKAMAYLADWYHQQVITGTNDVDPLMTVIREGGPFYTRDRLPEYIKHLKATGRAHFADMLVTRHSSEL